MELLIVRQPAEAAFSGNPMIYGMAITPFGAIQQQQGYQVVVKIEIEQPWGSGLWQEVDSAVIYPDSNGNVRFDVSEKINAQLQYFTPPLSLKTIRECPEQSKRYRLTYYLTNGTVIVVAPATSPVRYAIKGGSSQYQPFPDYQLANGTQLLTTAYHPEQRTDLIHPNEYRFIFFLARTSITPGGSAEMPTLEVTGYDSADNATYTYGNRSFQQWRVYCFPASLSTVFTVQPTKPKFIDYDFDWLNADTLRAQVNYRPVYQPIQLMYRNSMGGLDSIMLRGDHELEQLVERQQATLVQFPDRFIEGRIKPAIINTRGVETIARKGNTGFIPQWKVDSLRDLLLSEEVYQVESGRLLPIVISTNRSRLYGKEDDLFALQLEWQMANPSRYYSQPSSPAPACPLPLSFVVRQAGSKHLDIMWHLMDPYSIIEVEIIIDSNTTSFRYVGNVGRQKQQITNPATGTTALPITVRARTVCDPYSEPNSVSGWSTINMDIYANQGPTAVNDVYNINAGYTVPVPFTGSVLANDSDPDGDALTVTPATSQPTDAGGTYSITSSGNVTYTPPSSGYVGQDFFDYVITEAGGGLTATGRVFINVGTGNNNGFVFVRLEEVDVSAWSSGYVGQASGQRRARFYSDPAGTQAINPAALSLTLNVREVQFTRDFDGNENTTTTDTTVAATSGDILIFSGEWLNFNQDPYYSYEQIFSLTHSIQPGTGYIII